MVDVITTRQMLLPWVNDLILISVLGCQTEPHPICVADGTCQCFYSGMDC